MRLRTFLGPLSDSVRGVARSYWRPALALHALMLLLLLALVTPVATWIGNAFIAASGAPVVSNFDIARFALSAPGIAFFGIGASLSLGLLLAELAGLTWIAWECHQGRRASVASAVAVVLRRLPMLVLLAGRMLLRLALLAVPFVACAWIVGRATLEAHDLNYYLAEEPAEWRRAVAIAAGLAVVYGLIVVGCLLRWSFAVPLLVLAQSDARGALRDSARLAHRQLRRIALPLALWWGSLLVLGIIAGWAGGILADAGFDLAGANLGAVLALTTLCLASTLLGTFLVGGAQLAGHQFLVCRAYVRASGMARTQLHPAESDADARGRRGARAVLPALLALVAGSAGVGVHTAGRYDRDADVSITAHRGASAHAPENTLAAFRLAMEQGAEYVELDVQRTRDGTLVVLHDADFMRMAGVPRRVAELTAEEVAQIDIVRGRGAALAREQAPTLAEVIALARGRARLNIELKYNAPDPRLAPAVVDLLRRERFIDQAVVSSLDAGALRDVRRLEPRLRVGLIVTAAVGPVARADVDFLSLNAARVTPAVLRRARDAGKEVHVWTVNRPDAMLRMIERGVDNIITDDPGLLARVIRERNALDGVQSVVLRLRVLFDRPPREIVDPRAVPQL